jgi:hypothetical protein
MSGTAAIDTRDRSGCVIDAHVNPVAGPSDDGDAAPLQLASKPVDANTPNQRSTLFEILIKAS